ASPDRDDRRAVTEQALVHRDARAGALDLTSLGLSPKLPRQLAHLRDRLRRDRLAEAREPPARVDRDAAAEGGGAGTEQLLRPARLAQADVLVPVQLQGRRQVVHL